MRRALFGLLLAAAGVVGSASPAAAHAELMSTEPPSGAVLDAAPASVLLTFTEAVEVAPAAVRLFDRDGDRLDTGRSAQGPEGHRTVLAPLPDLDRGIYVVTWRVVSADGHPVRGAFTFRVGAAGAADGDDGRALAAKLLAAEGGDTTVGAAYGLVRLLVFASVVVAVGIVGFWLLVWPAGSGDDRARRLLGIALAVLAAATAISFGVHGAYVAALDPGSMVDPDVTRDTLDTRFGRFGLARLALIAAAAALLLATRRATRPSRVGALVTAGIGVLLLATLAGSGHAATGEQVRLALVVDVVHLAAVSVWLGGLVTVAAAVLRSPAVAGAEAVVARFSQVAAWAVIIIVMTGSLQGIRQLGSLDALTDTTYGRLLAIKVAAFVVLVAAAAVSRARVHRHFAPSPVDGEFIAPIAKNSPPAGERGGLSRLRRSVAAEVAIAAVVLCVTALLVNAVPGRSALAQPASLELQAGPVLVDVSVEPAKAGPVDLHLYTLTDAGRPLEVEELTATLTLTAKGIGPLDVPVTRAGPGHFSAYGFEVPIAGAWELRVSVRTSDVDESSDRATVRIR